MRRDTTRFRNYEFKDVRAVITVALPKRMIAVVVEKEMDKIVDRIRMLEEEMRELRHKMRMRGELT